MSRIERPCILYTEKLTSSKYLDNNPDRGKLFAVYQKKPADEYIKYLISIIEPLKGGIIKLRKKLNDDGEYSICRTDGKPMELFEVLDIDTILKEIDEALKRLEE